MTQLPFSMPIAVCALGTSLALAAPSPKNEQVGSKPNIIFVVADDMGCKDTGFSGNPVVKTPHLDEMAAKGLRFDNFYSAHATCSPGRMSILTGRTAMRARMVTTVGAMQGGEITLAKALKTAGYETGHFGKWGLGRVETHPMENFDEALWTKGFYENDAMFYVGRSEEKTLKLNGESSVATMELALDFIEKRAKRNQPFFVQVSFGSPHSPHVAAEEFKKLYPDLPEKEQNLWGEISGLDAALGQLRRELRRLEIADNTIVWFVSDNGGISKISQKIDRKGNIGARTIGLLEWPSKIPRPMRTSIPVSHMDMYPTVLNIVGVTMQHQPVVDGISLLPLFEGRMESRPKPIGFTNGSYANKDDLTQCRFADAAWLDGCHMLRLKTAKKNNAQTITLYDIVTDPAQEKDLADQQPEKVQEMLKALTAWREGVRASFAGKDYIR